MLLSLNVESTQMPANAGVPQLVRYAKPVFKQEIKPRKPFYFPFLVVLSLNILALSGAAAFLALIHFR